MPFTPRDYADRVTVDLPDLTTYEGVLFDLDGVLTPTAEVHMHAWRTMFTDLFTGWGVEPPYTDDDYYRYLDGKQRYDGVASLLRSRDVEIPWGDPSDPPTADTVCGVGNRKNEVFAAVLREEGIAPYPGSLALIEQLRAAGTPIGVVSSSKNAEEVLAAVARGLSNPQVGAELYVTEATVKTHLLRAYGKLGVDSRTGAVTEALRRGLLFQRVPIVARRIGCFRQLAPLPFERKHVAHRHIAIFQRIDLCRK